CEGFDFPDQRGGIERLAGKVGIVAAVMFGQIGQTDAEVRQQRVFGRRQTARRETGFEQRAPERVAGMRVICALGGRASAGCRTAEKQVKPGLQQIRQDRAIVGRDAVDHFNSAGWTPGLIYPDSVSASRKSVYWKLSSRRTDSPRCSF